MPESLSDFCDLTDDLDLAEPTCRTITEDLHGAKPAFPTFPDDLD